MGIFKAILGNFGLFLLVVVLFGLVPGFLSDPIGFIGILASLGSFKENIGIPEGLCLRTFQAVFQFSCCFSVCFTLFPLFWGSNWIHRDPGFLGSL